jgi:hypothetical protein
MPFRRLMLIAFSASLLGLGGYTLMATALRYFEVQHLVDATLGEVSQRRQFLSSMQRTIDGRDMAHELRAGILERAGRIGLLLEDDSLVVTRSDHGVTVAVRWAQPALWVAGRGILLFPMSTERTVYVEAR